MSAGADREELWEEFAELVSIDSPTYGERAMADVMKQKLTALGFQVDEDDSAAAIGGTAGNIYAYLKGTDSRRRGILLSSHLDTVSPALGKRAVLHSDGRITSAGDTVLGADDASGLVEILSGIRQALSSGEPYGDIEVPVGKTETLYILYSMPEDITETYELVYADTDDTAIWVHYVLK